MTPKEKSNLDSMAEKQAAAPNKHLKRLDAEISALERKVCDAMYVDDIAAASKAMDDMRNEPHVQLLRVDRNELAFLVKRRAQLVEVKNG